MTHPVSQRAREAALACRGCGSIMTRAELDAIRAINCCPERAMNEVIEERHGIPALTPGGVDPTIRAMIGDPQ